MFGFFCGTSSTVIAFIKTYHIYLKPLLTPVIIGFIRCMRKEIINYILYK